MNQKMAADRERQLEILKKVEEEAKRFFSQRETGKALPVWERQPIRRISDDGLGAEGAMDLFISEYAKGLALNSGSRFFGFVIGGVTPAALAGDWMTSLYDQNAFGELDCMDRQIEDEAIEGLKDLLGLRKDFVGSFTSGATMATTNALACAREWAAAKQGKTANDGIYGLERPVVLSAFAHASIYKGLSILGLGRNSIIEYGKLPGRDRGDVAKLEAELQKAAGKAIIVIANMGTASTGDLDDLRAIADLKKKYDFWLHVDGAVGALAMASPEYSGLYDGVEEADSITIDGHKWLNMNYDCAIALIRRDYREMQYRTYAQAVRVNDNWTESTPLEHLGNEGSRRFRALAVWMNLMAYGKTGFREMVERDCRLAAALADLLEESGVYQIHRPVLINGFAFTLNKPGVTGQEIMDLEKAIREEGTTYLNRADVDGVPHLRCSFSNWSIEEADMKKVADALVRIGKAFIA
ncbi:MAG: aspartate aminotransferase family protein [Lachnospiraceae bacterium]|jgi:glutamate/tyrosine decarboxylase-like PLP-dependent enzyme|nr:aspartate aminotransferase family protein [Lachnospiraceae bacterium]